MRTMGLALVGCCLLAAPAFAAIGFCTNTTEITTTGGNTISETPARICGVHFYATAANGYCVVYESPVSTDPTHAQARVVAEPGAATSRDADHVYFGDSGYPTRFGIGAYTVNGRCIIHWSP